MCSNKCSLDLSSTVPAKALSTHALTSDVNHALTHRCQRISDNGLLQALLQSPGLQVSVARCKFCSLQSQLMSFNQVIGRGVSVNTAPLWVSGRPCNMCLCFTGPKTEWSKRADALCPRRTSPSLSPTSCCPHITYTRPSPCPSSNHTPKPHASLLSDTAHHTQTPPCHYLCLTALTTSELTTPAHTAPSVTHAVVSPNQQHTTY